MKTKVIYFGIIAILILGATIDPTSAISNTFGEDWKYYREITITEISGKTLKDYQIMVELNQFNFPSGAKSDGSDLRFSDSENEKELSYYIENYDAKAKTARIWVKVPKIPQNGSVKIRMYYENDKATTKSNAGTTFDFYDDFLGDSLDESKWDVITRGEYLVSVSDSNLLIEGKCYNCGPDSGMVKVVTKDSFKPPMIAEFNSTFVHSAKNRGRSSWIGLCDNNIDAGEKSWGNDY